MHDQICHIHPENLACWIVLCGRGKICDYFFMAQIADLVVNYGISNTIVLEIP